MVKKIFKGHTKDWLPQILFFWQPYINDDSLIFFPGGIVLVSCKDPRNYISTSDITTMKTTTNILLTSEFTTMKPKTTHATEKNAQTTIETSSSSQRKNLQACEDYPVFSSP